MTLLKSFWGIKTGPIASKNFFTNPRTLKCSKIDRELKELMYATNAPLKQRYSNSKNHNIECEINRKFAATENIRGNLETWCRSWWFFCEWKILIGLQTNPHRKEIILFFSWWKKHSHSKPLFNATKLLAACTLLAFF